MDELPRHIPRTPGSIPNNTTRKRIRLSSFNAPSSDPPIFSSDDNPDADNYLPGSEHRRKKQFRGPWFQQVLHSDTASQDGFENSLPSRKTERKFERNYDSGVFMASDGTDAGEEFQDNLPVEEVHESALSIRQTAVASRSQPEKSPEEAWVEERVQSYLEEGNERIDLSGHGLSTITNAAIRPLATFATIPPVSEDVFLHLEPKLKIFLSSNNLTSLPEELFHLERLVVLSLRGNRLRELPPAIGKLTNLKEFNVSLNELPYLPFEILDLFSDTHNLKSVNLHPNPFLQPRNLRIVPSFDPIRRGALCEGMRMQRRSWSPQWKVLFRARSDVRYFDKCGLLKQGPNFEGDGNDIGIPMADVTVDPEPPASTSFTSGAPSLVELALQSCLRSKQLPQLPHLLYNGPDHIYSLLDQAKAMKESGVGECTICKRKFVVKRTEWIEWWEITSDLSPSFGHLQSAIGNPLNQRTVIESKVPLVRRGCSWLCVPENMDVVESKEEEEETPGLWR